MTVNPFKVCDMVVNNKSEYDRSIRNRDFTAVKSVRGNMMSDLRESELQSQNIKSRSKEWAFIPICYTIQQDVKTWWNRFKLFAEQNDINSNDLRNFLASFMDDRCLQRFEYRVPKGPTSLFEQEKYMVNLFGWQPASQTDYVAEFYNRIQLPGEDYRDFYTNLWHLAKYAFSFRGYFDQISYDFLVKDRFVIGLNEPFIFWEVDLANPQTLIW
ncbi:unnamed protein product [Brachionus calyciflorus]|uniref:Uncharacterized protein n=1 Tax=Brachionus calyciflorus TaxID=104777 RepID=A0A814MXZ9_9BILA|nr:unnamed protein product [Brachionus calyciflorus]